MSLTKTVCQTLSLMLIDGLTLLYNNIDIIAGTNVVKFGTFPHYKQTNLELPLKHLNSNLHGDNFVFEKLIRTENYLLSTALRICQLNGKNDDLYNK